MSPTWVSRAQSPPAAALPVSLVEAATSAPVQRASSVTRVLPAAPAPMLQPYSWMSALSVRLPCHCCRVCASWPTLSALMVRLPRVNWPAAPWDSTWIESTLPNCASAAEMAARPSWLLLTTRAVTSPGSCATSCSLFSMRLSSTNRCRAADGGGAVGAGASVGAG
ncbi:hypothetical protein D3C76_712020 [compost metagenome]